VSVTVLFEDQDWLLLQDTEEQDLVFSVSSIVPRILFQHGNKRIVFVDNRNLTITEIYHDNRGFTGFSEQKPFSKRILEQLSGIR